MAKGGYRSGSGRPRGATTGSGKRPRRLTLATGPSPAELKEARDRARVWLQQNEHTLIDEFMASNDPRLKLEVWKVLKTYGDGPPKHQLEVTHRKSPEQVLDEIALRALTVEVIPEQRQITEGAPVEGASPARARVDPSDSLPVESERLGSSQDASGAAPGATNPNPQDAAELAEWDEAHRGKP